MAGKNLTDANNRTMATSDCMFTAFFSQIKKINWTIIAHNLRGLEYDKNKP